MTIQNLLLFFLIISVVVVYSYRGFFRPLSNYNDYIKRATNYELFFQKRKAVEIFRKALDDTRLTDFEKASILLEMGVRFCKYKEYTQATTLFDDSFDIVLDTPFRFTNKLILVLKAYLYANQKEKAIFYYHNFLDRQSYDPKFKKIKELEGVLNR